jgi:hypothetical protein
VGVSFSRELNPQLSFGRRTDLNRLGVAVAPLSPYSSRESAFSLSATPLPVPRPFERPSFCRRRKRSERGDLAAPARRHEASPIAPRRPRPAR